MKLRTSIFTAIGAAAVLSAAGLSEDARFVLSGDYFEARAAAADCDRRFIPALSRDRGAIDIQSAALLPFDLERAAYTYRMLDVPAEAITVYRGTEYEGLELAAGTRMETYVGRDIAVSVVSGWTTAGTCGRLVLMGDAALQVQIPQSQNRTSDEFWNTYLSDLGGTTSSQPQRTVTQIPIPAGTGTMTAKVYIDGKPAQDIQVTLSAWPLAHPPEGIGRTLAHNHIAVAPQQYEPTIRLNGGLRAIVTTNEYGEAEVAMTAGSRGGPEGVRGEFEMDGLAFVGDRAVVVRHGRAFEHFAEALGFSAANPPRASDEFPFVLVGYTPEHHYAHWLQAGKSRAIANALLETWRMDEGRAAAGEPAYLVVNDMSLEYGGAFHLRAGAACTIEETRGQYWAHAGHNTGLEVDISPCYSADMTHGGGAACASGVGRKIDERVLAANIIGRIGGVVLVEGENSASFHYHLRFPAEY